MAQGSEIGGLVAVLCEDDTSADCRNGAGKLKTRPGVLGQDYGRRRGAFGGNAIIEGGAEILFPLPFIKDQRSLQTSLFLDVGNVFDTNCGSQQRNCFDVSANELKASFGLGLTWLSSFGPMTFSMAQKLGNEEPSVIDGKDVYYDDFKFFQFSLGQTF